MKMGVKTIVNDKPSLVKRRYVTLYNCLTWVKEDTLSVFFVYFNKDVFVKKLDILLSLVFP